MIVGVVGMGKERVEKRIFLRSRPDEAAKNNLPYHLSQHAHTHTCIFIFIYSPCALQ